MLRRNVHAKNTQSETTLIQLPPAIGRDERSIRRDRDAAGSAGQCLERHDHRPRVARRERRLTEDLVSRQHAYYRIVVEIPARSFDADRDDERAAGTDDAQHGQV
jgi:hypothetical protein